LSCDTVVANERYHIITMVLQAASKLERSQWLFLNKSGFTGRRSRSHAQPGLRIYPPGDKVVQLYPRTRGIHFSRFLRHAWATLGIFLSPATTREIRLQEL